MAIKERIPTSFANNEIFRNLDNAAKIAGLSLEQKRAYDHSLKSFRDTYAIMKTERAEGMAEGIAKGETKRSREIARNMLAGGFAPDLIAQLTGLSIDEIRALN